MNEKRTLKQRNAGLRFIKRYHRIPLEQLFFPVFKPIDPTIENPVYTILGLRNNMGSWVIQPDPDGYRADSSYFIKTNRVEIGSVFFFVYKTPDIDRMKLCVAVVNELKHPEPNVRPELGWCLDFSHEISDKTNIWLERLTRSSVFNHNVASSNSCYEPMMVHDDIQSGGDA